MCRGEHTKTNVVDTKQGSGAISSAKRSLAVRDVFLLVSVLIFPNEKRGLSKDAPRYFWDNGCHRALFFIEEPIFYDSFSAARHDSSIKK